MKPLAWIFIFLFAFAQYAFAGGVDGHDNDARDVLDRDIGSSTTSTSSQSITTAGPQITISIDPEVDTCTSTPINWSYAGPDGLPLSLTVTNFDVPQNPAQSGQMAKRVAPTAGLFSRDLVTVILASGLNPNDDSFAWLSVDVPQGYYVIAASIEGQRTLSQPFLVNNGSDTSCLGGSTGQSSSTTTSAFSTGISSNTGTGSTTGSAVTSATSSAVLAKSINKGAMAGGIIGGLAIVAAVVAAFLFLRYSSSTSSFRRRPDGGVTGKWGNLGSFDSSNKNPRVAKAKVYNKSVGLAGIAMAAADPPNRKHSQHDSIGPIMSLSSSHGHRDSLASPGASGSNEDADYVYASSPYEEKSPFSDSGHEMGIIPIGYEPPSSAGATGGHGTKHSSFASSTYSYAQNNNFSRPRSQSNKLTSSQQSFPETPPNVSDLSLASHRASSPPIQASYLEQSQPSTPAYPSGVSATAFSDSSPSPMEVVEESSSTPTARKTPRKPVPKYNPQDPSLNMDNRNRLADVPLDIRDHDLAHKSSFASVKQMHVLIPDPPPPQRD